LPSPRSFAKSVAPGLRLGYVTATPEIATRMANGGLLDSGGGMNHFAATVLAEYAASGDYLRQVERFRNAYRGQRDRLMAGLAASVADATCTRPGGGFFVWVQLPPSVSVNELGPIAIAHGMAFLPAQRFYLHGAEAPNAIRLAFSMYPPDTLEEAASRLGAAADQVRR